jgi:hypothetical protein
VPDHLPDRLRRATVVPLGAAFLTAKPPRAVLAKHGAKLEIALLAVAELPRSANRPQALAFPLDEHQQFARDLILGGHPQQATRSGQHVPLQIELCHPRFLRKDRLGPSRPLGRIPRAS